MSAEEYSHTLHFVLPSPLVKGTQTEQRYLARLNALRVWLLRSGSVPISISLAKYDMLSELVPDWGGWPWKSCIRGTIPGTLPIRKPATCIDNTENQDSLILSA